MSSDIKQIFSEKKFPDNIKNHNIFRSYKNIKKVFPEIGLPNSEKEIEIDNTEEAKRSAESLLYAIDAEISKRLNSINKYAVKKADMGDKRKSKLQNSKELLTKVKQQISRNKKNCVISNNGKITLNLSEDVVADDKKVIFRAGEGLFRVYNKLNEALREGHFLAMEKIETFDQFKDFSSKNVPSLKYKIRFSSDGAEGLWDIATMSMRGIQSCQTWGTGNATHLVGSMVDPFTAIIYLTSGGDFGGYGSKMMRRCVVRFVINGNTNVPYLAIERMYPAMEKASLDKFTEFLKEKTDNKFNVIYLDGRSSANFYVPMSKIVAALPVQDQPYKDSQMQYKEEKVRVDLRKEIKAKIDTICHNFASKTIASMRAIKISTVPENSKKAFKSFRGTDHTWNESYGTYQDLMAMARSFFTVEILSFYDDSYSCLKDVSEKLSNKLDGHIFETLKKSANLRSGKLRGRISDEILAIAATNAAEKINVYLQEQVKKLKPTKKDLAKKEKSAIFDQTAYADFL